MPRYNVKLQGDAWCELVASVEAEDENEAREKARQSGTWRIVGDVKPVTATAVLNVPGAGDEIHK